MLRCYSGFHMRNTKDIVIYSAITRDYNPLRNPIHINPYVDYISFTDQLLWKKITNNTIWKTRSFPAIKLDPVRMNRFVKLLPHRFFPGYEFSVYVDGHINIIGDIRYLLEKYDYPDMLCFKHPHRSCAYEEGKACILHKKDSPQIIMKQLEYYRQEGLPENFGLIEGGVLIRRHNRPAVKQLMEDWWEQVRVNSKRDQVSFPFVAWKNGFWPITMGDENVWGNSKVFLYDQLRHHGAKSFNLKHRLKVLMDLYIKWRF